MKSIVSINERIKDLRVEKGLNLNELSAETGLPASTLSDYEQDYATVPHTSVITLADYFGVSTDFLLGMTDVRLSENKEISDLHLSDKAIEKLKDERINARLLSEIIENDGFTNLMMDAESYVDGHVEDFIQISNRLMDLARNQITKDYNNPDDVTMNTLGHMHYAQEDYFAGVLTNDLIPILKDIKAAHKKDPTTSDGGYSTEDIMHIIEVVTNTKGGKRKKISTMYNELLRIGHSKKNIDRTAEMLSKEDFNVDDAAELISRSKLIEPNVREARRKN